MVETEPGHDGYSAVMVDEIDIFRTANILVKHHREDATVEVAMIWSPLPVLKPNRQVNTDARALVACR